MHSVAPPPKDPLTEPGPWNAIAAGYDELYFRRLPELSDAAIELLSPEKEDTVLDVATGPGTLAVRLAPRVHRVVAIDFAEAMLERLRLHVLQNHLHNLEVRLMNGEELQLETGSFDSAISLFGLFSFDDRKRAMEELFRVVVPGGRVVTSSWASPDQNTLLGAGIEAMRLALPDWEAPGGRLATEDPAKCEAELDAIGFESVRTQLFKSAVKFASVKEYWDLFQVFSPRTALLKQHLGEAGFAEVSRRIVTELEARFGASPLSLDCAAIFSYGEVPRSAA